MRTLPLLLLPCALGCGGQPPARTEAVPPVVQPKPTAKTQPVAVVKPPEFDPNDAERTLRWVALLHEQARDVPAGNQIAAAAAWNKMLAKLDAVKGQKVNWRFPLKEIRIDSLIVQPLTIPKGFDPGIAEQFDEPTSFQLSLYVQKSNANRLDSLSLPNEPWINTSRAGDLVTVKGTIQKLDITLFDGSKRRYSIWAHLSPTDTTVNR